MPSIQRNLRIDSARILALLVIILYHCVQRWPYELPLYLRSFASLGQYGVDIFFALSGLLIGASVSKRMSWNPRCFDWLSFGRRLARVYPTYLAACMTAFAGVQLARPEHFELAYFVLVQNYLPEIPFFLVSWFLCILFAFYFLAALLPGFSWLDQRSSSLLLLLMALSCPIQRAFLLLSGSVVDSVPFGYYLTATNLRADSIALGFSLGLIVHSIDSSRRLFPRLAFIVKPTGMWLLVFAWVLTLMVVRSFSFPFEYLLAPSVSAVFSVSIAAKLYSAPDLRSIPRLTCLVKPVASLSLCLYLTHPFGIEAFLRLNELLSMSPSLSLVVLILLISVFALAFFCLIERPFQRLVSKFFPLLAT